MERQQHSKPTVIDEDGKPFIDAGLPGGGMPDGSMPGGGLPGPGFPMGAPIPERLLNRKGKLSLARLLGWKGIAILVLVVAGLIALAAASAMVMLFVLPVLLLLGVVGAVTARVRGHRRPPGGARGPQIVVVRR
ncbi:hypothetical protein [Cumulibacter manganitolerans]|uniref:hypothetical protein n=1 Tax=Cumulibacter manganitolerans TaxID=1884992 RepID=UPI0012957364|nr:hypothetical protein [Cumulibacter manganitolerans]